MNNKSIPSEISKHFDISIISDSDVFNPILDRFRFDAIDVLHYEIFDGFHFEIRIPKDVFIIILPVREDGEFLTQEGLERCSPNGAVSFAGEEVATVRIGSGAAGYAVIISKIALARRYSANRKMARIVDFAFGRHFEPKESKYCPLRTFISAFFSHEIAKSFALFEGLQNDICNIFLDLIIEYLPISAPTIDSSRPPEYINHAIKLLSGTEPILTVAHLARKCGVSVRALQYSFREYELGAPAKVLKSARLEMARQAIMRQPNAAIVDIAGRYGFTNLSRFREAFSERYGESPIEFRRKLRGR